MHFSTYFPCSIYAHRNAYQILFFAFYPFHATSTCRSTHGGKPEIRITLFSHSLTIIIRHPGWHRIVCEPEWIEILANCMLNVKLNEIKLNRFVSRHSVWFNRYVSAAKFIILHGSWLKSIKFWFPHVFSLLAML